MGVAYRTAPRRRRVIPYDAAKVMRREEDSLLAVVTRGLSKVAGGRPYLLRDHPRLESICRAMPERSSPLGEDLEIVLRRPAHHPNTRSRC